MEILKELLSVVEFTGFQRDLAKSGLVMFPLSYTTLYLIEPGFRHCDLVSRILFSVSIVFIFLLFAGLMSNLVNRIARTKVRLSASMLLTPVFIAFAGTILFWRGIDADFYKKSLLFMAFCPIVYGLIILFSVFLRFFMFLKKPYDEVGHDGDEHEEYSEE